MSFTKQKAERLYEKLRAREPNTPGVLGVPPNGVGAGVIGSVALGTGAATTTDVTDARIVPGRTACLLEPSDLYGSAEKGAGNIWVDFPADGIARIHHTASTKTRTFTYLLMFGLAFLLATGAFGQVIEDDGVPLEVAPALNFTDEIVCTAGASSTDCGLVIDGSGDVMLISVFATGATYAIGPPYVDFAEVAYHADFAAALDADANDVPELTCALSICVFDANQDGSQELNFTASSVTFFPSLATQVTYTLVGTPAMQGTGFAERFSEFMGVGRSAFYGTSSASNGNSACIGRNNTADWLHTDKDCDSQTVGGPETSGSVTGTTNTEAFLDDAQRMLSATLTTNGATDATGVQVTNLKLDLDWPGVWTVEYYLLDRSAAAGNGIAYGVTYVTGALTSLFCTRSFVSTGVTCPAVPACLLLPCPAIPACGATGIIDDVAATNAGQMVEGYAANAVSTVAPNLGPNTGVATAASTNLDFIRCHVTTTTVGDLQLWVASENNGTTVSVMAGSTARAHAFP